MIGNVLDLYLSDRKAAARAIKMPRVMFDYICDLRPVS
jgi:hypothetical protein